MKATVCQEDIDTCKWEETKTCLIATIVNRVTGEKTIKCSYTEYWTKGKFGKIHKYSVNEEAHKIAWTFTENKHSKQDAFGKFIEIIECK